MGAGRRGSDGFLRLRDGQDQRHASGQKPADSRRNLAAFGDSFWPKLRGICFRALGSVFRRLSLDCKIGLDTNLTGVADPAERGADRVCVHRRGAADDEGIDLFCFC